MSALEMPTEKPRDIVDLKLRQARAMILAISGAGLDGFDELHDHDKDNYLCAVVDVVEQAIKEIGNV